jgi:hypothetical protein
MADSQNNDQSDASSSRRKSRSRSDGRLGNGWIGVDLDGTLAQWETGHSSKHIGPPVQSMLDRVKRWITMGIEVRIFTARASVESHIPPVEEWLKTHGLEGLKVTNVKDYRMLQLWDDRAIQVIPNTGELFKNSVWVDERKRILDNKEAAEAAEAGDDTTSDDQAKPA